MQVSRNSWHYKLCYHSNNLFSENDVTNLCRYFWSIIISFIVLITIGGLFLVLCGSMLTSWICACQGIFPWTEGFQGTRLGMIYGIGLMFTALAIIIIIIAGVNWTIEKARDKFRFRSETEKPGPIRMWLRAREEKVCPLIEYVD